MERRNKNTHISAYPSPYVTTDGVVLRFVDRRLEVLLAKRPDDAEVCAGQWSLPGGFCGIDRRLEDTLREKVLQKTGVSGFYCEQLKTYDELERDGRGRVITVAYICLLNKPCESGDWFMVSEDHKKLVHHSDENMNLSLSEDADGGLVIPALAFDHARIIQDAIERIDGKMWYTNILGYLLPETFTISEAKELCEQISGRHQNNMLRRLAEKTIPTGTTTQHPNGGRYAKMYRWNFEN